MDYLADREICSKNMAVLECCDVKITKTQKTDMESVMKLYDRSRVFMRQTGNASQWINGYPSEEVVEKDIVQGNSYVCVENNSHIVGVFCFFQGVEPNYAKIEEGEWLNDKPYGVIHRLSSSGQRKGIADICIRWCFQQCPNVRVDTHQDNRVMQKILEKNGFQRCGIIYVEDGSPRIAFQKCV